MPDGDPRLRAANEITPTSNNQSGSTDSIFARPQQPGKFGSILKGIGGFAASLVPGVGATISSLINRGGPDFGSMQAMIQQQERSAMRMLAIQHEAGEASDGLTTVSNLLKARHDSEMSAVRNFKS